MPTSNSERPLLSMVVLVDQYETIRPVVERLQAQRAPEQIELVVVAEDADRFGLPDTAPGSLGAIRIVEHSRTLMRNARAAGVRAAAGDVVVLGETHAFPAPGWADALLHAHEQEWVIVTPGLRNANPGSRLSWAGFLLNYGRWMDGMRARPISSAAGYNSSYKRSALLAFDDELESLLWAGSALHDRMRSRGWRFYFEPAAKVDHLNVTHPADWFAEIFISARFLAGNRRLDWSLLRRLAYVLGSPLLPGLFVMRALPALRLAGSQRKLPRGWLAAFLLACIVSGSGELVGYLAGAGDSETRTADYEEHRTNYAAAAVPE
jgi:hypothetical protein